MEIAKGILIVIYFIVALALIILTLIVIESSTIVNVYKVLKTTWL